MIIHNARKIIVLSFAVLVAACNDASTTSTVSYECKLPCLKSDPTLSTGVVSSATGGVVDISFELDGDLTNIESVFVLLEPVGGGLSIGPGPLWSPIQSQNTVSITVDAGTALGDYYPRFSFKHVSPDNTGSQYYLDLSHSKTQYVYYEWLNGTSTTLMQSPFNVPMLKIQN